jgi:hypothetical protein
MQLVAHRVGDRTIVEVVADTIVLRTEQDVLDLMATAQYQHRADALALHARNLADDFLDLRSGLAGAVLQKISNYRFRLAVLGDFTEVTSRALRDFIGESNRSGQVVFAGDLAEATALLF